MSERTTCDTPLPGWAGEKAGFLCNRAPGHDSPCWHWAPGDKEPKMKIMSDREIHQCQAARLADLSLKAKAVQREEDRAAQLSAFLAWVRPIMVPMKVDSEPNSGHFVNEELVGLVDSVMRRPEFNELLRKVMG